MNDQPIWTNEWATYHYTNWKKFLGKFRDVPATGLEIGSCEGRSSCFFVQNILTHAESKLICVDPWVVPGTEERFQHNIDVLGCRSKMEVHKTFSDRFDLSGHAKVDFVYVDGCHTAPATLKDGVRAWVALKTGGVMIFDDVMWRINELPRVACPKLAIDAFLTVFEKEMKVLCLGGQAIVEKISP